MKKPTKLLLLMTVFAVLFSCDCYHEDLNMMPETDFTASPTADELKVLIQNDPLTIDHNLMARQTLLTILEQGSNVSSESLEANPESPDEILMRVISMIDDETSTTYHRSLSTNYPEIEGMSIEQQVELIFDIKLSDIEETNEGYGPTGLDMLKELGYLYSDQIGTRSICSPILDALMSVSTAMYNAMRYNHPERLAVLLPVAQFLNGALRLCLALTR